MSPFFPNFPDITSTDIFGLEEPLGTSVAYMETLNQITSSIGGKSSLLVAAASEENREMLLHARKYQGKHF